MKPLACLLALVLAAPALAQNAPTHPDLRAELMEMHAADQEIRHRLMAGGLATPDLALALEMMQGDAARTARLVEIVDAHGWPTAEMVGREAVGAAFLLVQHADASPDVQQRMLPLVEASWQAGDLSGQSYALLVDRVRVGQGEPQVYGTQTLPVHLWTDGEPTPAPLEDPEGVDARRAAMGMTPLAEYLQGIREMLDEAAAE